MNLKQKLKRNINRLEKDREMERRREAETQPIPTMPNSMAQNGMNNMMANPMAQPPWMHNPMNYMPPYPYKNHYDDSDSEEDRHDRKKRK